MLGISLGFVACKSNPTVQPSATPALAVEENTAEPVPAITPSPTATDAPDRRKLVLIGSQESSSEIPYAAIQALLQELADQDQLLFESVPGLTVDSLTEDMAVVVAVPPDPDIAALAAAGGATQFLAVGIPGLRPSSNLSVIDGDSVTPDKKGFVAGYLAAVISKEWRVGMIGLSGSDQSQLARQGFLNGVTYYCGLCRSPYPPFYTYPIWIDLPPSPGSSEAQTAAESIISQAVNTVFIYPGADDQTALDTLAQAGLAMIGTSRPSSSVSENWVATIQVDPLPAIREIWPELLAGQGGLEQSLAISLVNRNERLFSPGRQLLVDEFLSDFQAGFINTGVAPSTP